MNLRPVIRCVSGRPPVPDEGGWPSRPPSEANRRKALEPHHFAVDPPARSQERLRRHQMHLVDGRARCVACERAWPCEPVIDARAVLRDWRCSSDG